MSDSVTLTAVRSGRLRATRLEVEPSEAKTVIVLLGDGADLSRVSAERGPQSGSSVSAWQCRGLTTEK